jgi:hypothetical protein
VSLDPSAGAQPGQPGPGPGAPAGPGQPAGGMPGVNPSPAAGGPGGPAAAPGAAGPAAPAPDAQRGRADGRSYADARNQVGANFASQHRVESAARADFQRSLIKGSVYTNSNIFQLSFGQGTAQVRANQINAEELTAPFVPSTGAERLAHEITGYPFVVLHGPRGYGKRATLLWALRRQVHDDAAMLYLDPSTDLATFSCDGIPEHAVMIVQDVPDGMVDRLDEHTVKRIESELRAGNRCLAVTTTRAAAGAAHSTGFLVAELATRPEPRQVFSRHLAKLLLGTGLAKDDVLGWAGVDMLVAELGPDSSLEDAARLARLLSRADRNEPEQAAARVRAQMTEYADEKVAQWFRKLRTLKAQCMAISLGVLNGQSRELIAHQAALLEKQIMPAPDSPSAPAFVNPLDQDATVSASLLDARVTTETRMTEHGPIIIDAMTYREPGYPGQVLRYVWRAHDGARAAIVSWLRDLGASHDLTVRVRAATAAGVLACQALDFVHDQVICRWAGHGNEEVRNSAAIALGPPAEDQVLRPTIRSLVDGWAREDSDWRLRATAARAYGRTIGLTSPTAALRGLSRLAEVDDVDLTIAVGNSYCELILEGTGPLAVRVMTEVERLAAERMREKQATGRLTLLGLSYPRGAPPSMSEHEARLRDWPTLLVLALANAKLAESAARLWQLALNDPDIGGMVRDSLDDWAEAAEGSGEMRDCLVQFLLWIAADERGRRAVTRQAQAWIHRDGRAPATGRSMIAALGY